MWPVQCGESQGPCPGHSTHRSHPACLDAAPARAFRGPAVQEGRWRACTCGLAAGVPAACRLQAGHAATRPPLALAGGALQPTCSRASCHSPRTEDCASRAATLERSLFSSLQRGGGGGASGSSRCSLRQPQQAGRQSLVHSCPSDPCPPEAPLCLGCGQCSQALGSVGRQQSHGCCTPARREGRTHVGDAIGAPASPSGCVLLPRVSQAGKLSMQLSRRPLLAFCCASRGCTRAGWRGACNLPRSGVNLLFYVLLSHAHRSAVRSGAAGATRSTWVAVECWIACHSNCTLVQSLVVCKCAWLWW
jgi:hypothetical protein